MFDPEGPTLRELAKQALSSTDRGYDLLAPKFDHTPFRTPDAMLERAAARIAASGQVPRVLDICCGTGAGVRWFRPIASEAIVGIDRSAGMLEEAKAKLVDAPGDAPIELVRGDAMKMPFDDSEFDLAVSFGAFGHILSEDEPRFVREIRRVLKPGGRFVFITGEMPPVWSPTLWMARGFNAAIRARNLLLKPEFIMYYLTFMLPEVKRLLEHAGYTVRVESGVFPAPFSGAKLVIATAPASVPSL